MTTETEIATFAERAVLCWLATVDTNGAPSVSPKELWTCLEGSGELVIADIMSSNSVRNIRANPQVCVSFVDVFRQKGFKLYGSAEIIPRENDAFAEDGAPLLDMAGETFFVRHVIKVSVERSASIIAPSYKLFPDIGEQKMMDAAYATYGVAPRPPSSS